MTKTATQPIEATADAKAVAEVENTSAKDVSQSAEDSAGAKMRIKEEPADEIKVS